MKKSTKKKIVKAAKKTPTSIIVCALLFLLIGAGSGFMTSKILTENDTFEIVGEQTINLNIGDTYNDKGAKAIEFNKDISSDIVVSGLDKIDTSKEGKYQIIYSLNSKRYKDIKRVRYVIVSSESGDNNE